MTVTIKLIDDRCYYLRDEQPTDDKRAMLGFHYNIQDERDVLSH